MSESRHGHEPEIWVATDEPVVTFFLHLKEPIGWPAGLPIRDHVAIGPQLHRLLEPESDLVDSDPPIADDNLPKDLIHAYVLASSILFHRVPIDLGAASGIDATFAALEYGVPSVGDAKDQDATRETDVSGVATVAEVAIPLQTMAAIHAADRSDLDFVLPTPQEAVELIDQAFDAAVGAVARFQQSYHAVTRHPVTLLTRETLPSFIPYVMRKLGDISQTGPVEVSMFLVNDNMTRFVEPRELDSSEVEAVHRASQHQDNALLVYLDLHRQGSVALGQGNTREAVVMFATASEALLNIVLCHLRWEEGATPEQSAADWPDGLVTRVKTQYATRLGGSWDLAGKGPVGAWQRDVAAVRNRVVHAGYLPTRAEAEKSMSAVEDLLTFIGDRLVYGKNLRRYPRTSAELLHEGGLRRRGRYPNWLKSLQADPTEPVWHEHFGRWYATHLRILADVERPRVSDEARAELLCIFSSVDRYEWVLRDPETFQAAKSLVKLPEAYTDPAVAFRMHIEGDVQYPVSVSYERGSEFQVTRQGPWVEQYRLCPLLGVMRDMSDLDSL